MSPVAFLHLVTFFFFLAYGLTIPSLPLYLESLGLKPAWIGWAVSLMPLAGLLLRPFGGWATDAWSRRLPALLGLVASAAAGFFYLGPLAAVLIGRFLQGVGIALFAPSTLALTSDLADEEVVGRVMGTRNLLIGLGVMLGTALGGTLLDLGGPKAVFLLVFLVQLPWLIPMAKTPETLIDPKPRRWWEGFVEVFALAPLRASTWANAGFAAVFSILQAFYPLFLIRNGYPASWVGGFLGYYSLVSVLARLPAGMLADKKDPARVALFGFVVATLGFFLLWAFPLPLVAFAGGTLMGLGAGFYLPANIVVVTKAVPFRLRGSAFSLFTASWDAGGLLGPPLAGMVIGLTGVSAIFPLAALGALLTTVGYVLLLPRR